jgi:DNA polymerase-1
VVAKTVSLPNIRSLFLPDPGMTIFDADLDRADAQVVAWEADDQELKAAFRAGIDVHTRNQETINRLLSSDRITITRQQAKMGVHATNYGASPFALAQALQIPKKAAEAFQSAWFAAHPNIHLWHQRIEEQLLSSRYVENKFGYRRHYFDRPDDLLKEALAWIPQSTVALVINKGDLAIYSGPLRRELGVQTLLQVHDSLVGQFPTHLTPTILPLLRATLSIPIPYPDPLTIGVGIKVSTRSWGECQSV